MPIFLHHCRVLLGMYSRVARPSSSIVDTLIYVEWSERKSFPSLGELDASGLTGRCSGYCHDYKYRMPAFPHIHGYTFRHSMPPPRILQRHRTTPPETQTQTPSSIERTFHQRQAEPALETNQAEVYFDGPCYSVENTTTTPIPEIYIEGVFVHVCVRSYCCS